MMPNHAAYLSTLLQVEHFVLLFGKTGVGKTQFIHKELTARLLTQGFLPIYINLATKESLSQSIKEALNSSAGAAAMQEQLAFFVKDRAPSIWEYLKAFPNQNALPVFIFDQFEVFFSQDKNERTALTDCLSSLLHRQLPDAVQEQMRAIPRRERTEQHLAWMEAIEGKVLLVLRAEQLDKLDGLSQQLPSIFNRRYQLPPWGKEEAEAALAALSQQTGLHYAPEAQAAILKELADDKDQEIAPFQLDLVHHYLHQKIGAKTASLLDLQQLGGVGGALLNYYKNFLSKQQEQDQQAASYLLEEELLFNGRRLFLPEEVIVERHKISPTLLQKMLEARLLAPERDAEGLSYGIAHDSLADAISLHRKESLAAAHQKALEAQEQKRKEEQALFIKKQKTLKRRNRIYAVFLVIMVFLAGVVLLLWIETSKQEQKIKAFIDNDFQSQFKKAIANHFIKGKYEMAEEAYNSALVVVKSFEMEPYWTDTLKAYISDCNSILERKKAFFEQINLAGAATKEDDLDVALRHCVRALDTEYNTPTVRQIMDNNEFYIADFIAKHPEKQDEMIDNLIYIYQKCWLFYHQRQGFRDIAYSNDKDNFQYYNELRDNAKAWYVFFKKQKKYTN